MTAASNKQNVPLTMFQALYTAPLAGDLTAIGDVTTPIGTVVTRPDVSNDYCAKTRAAGMTVAGAIDHINGGCVTTRPPTGPGGTGPRDDTPINGDAGTTEPGSAGGCCSVGHHAPSQAPIGIAFAGVVLGFVRRKRAVADACARADIG